jgi:ketosteroid isomerase-like protein
VDQVKAGAIARAILFVLSIMTFGAPAWADAGTDIRALEDRFVAAFKAKDVDAIMKLYVPGQALVVFDVVPPRQYVGAAAYRKDWQTFLGNFDGPITVELTDLDIGADRNLAYSHSIQRVAGTDKQGKKLDLTVRVTDVYQKIRGRWFIVHEHVSVPVDLNTDKPDLASKP